MRIRSTILVGTLCVLGGASAAAQDLPDVAIYRAMLDASRVTGWVAFREYDGKQLVYFTAVQNLHCRLSEIRYSINSDALDQNFPVTRCIPALPWSLAPDAPMEDLLIELPSGTAKTLTVQVVWENGKESDAETYAPCPDVDEMTCAMLAE
jgi:hypothetical protein